MIYRVNVALTDMASLDPWVLSLSLSTNHRHVIITLEWNNFVFGIFTTTNDIRFSATDNIDFISPYLSAVSLYFSMMTGFATLSIMTNVTPSTK